MFNKEDFQNGMVIELNTGRKRLFWNGRLMDEYGYIPLSCIDEDFHIVDTINEQYVVKVFLTHDIGYLGSFFRDENLTCIWKREGWGE